MQISEFAIRKPITTVMLCTSLVVLGAISLTRLPLEYAPSLDWPSMYISANYPSSSPKEVEREITRPLEEALATLPGVKALASWSRGSGTRVRMEFEHGTDMDLMSIQVRDRLDQVRNTLPDDLERVEVQRWNTDDWPIIDYSLTWKGNDADAMAYVCQNVIIPRLQRIQGVGGVEVQGLRQRALLVELDQQRLDAHNIGIQSLNSAIRGNNVNISAGDVRDGGRRYAVRAVGEFETVEQIRTLPLNQAVSVNDVADVTYDFPERRWFERLDGLDAVGLEIRKSSTANLVSTAGRVREEVERILDDVGRDKLQIKLIRDRSTEVTAGISNLTQSAAMGGMLAVMVIFLFLRNFRSTVIIGASIPVSAFCVFVMMYLLRQLFDASITLNLISMMGLMVAIGMLVDPAVVTLENIFRKRFDEGVPPIEAAIEGAREIGMPVLAAALTTVCVFVPLVFVTDSGNSMWMRDFAVTVVISVVASMGVALTVVPMVVARAYGDEQNHIDRWLKIGIGAFVAFGLAIVVQSNGIAASIDWVTSGALELVTGLGKLPPGTWVVLAVVAAAGLALRRATRRLGLRGMYEHVVLATLRHRWTTVSVACAILGLGFYVYSKVEKRPYRYQPTRRVEFRLDMPRSYDIDETRAAFDRIEDILIPRKSELDIANILTRFDRRDGSVRLYLTSVEEARVTTDEVRNRVMELLPTDLPGVEVRQGRGGGGDSGVEVEIFGRNPAVLDVLAEEIGAKFRLLEGVKEVESSLESGSEEIRVLVDRTRAQRHGLSPERIARTMSTALGTRGSSKFVTANGEIDITVLLEEEDRQTLEALKNTTFPTSDGGDIAFGSLASFDIQRGPRTIERQDRMSTVEIYATTDRADAYRVGTVIQEMMENYPFPGGGYGYEMGRNFRRATEEQGTVSFTMLFAALLIYLIMAALFESYVHPFTIMFSIGFAFIGVAFGLYAFEVPMDTNASYGLLILFGIVVNNGIVLVDHVNRYRSQGLFRREAIIRGGQDRLRPIAMTAMTTILGLMPLVIPMIYGTAEGYARRWGPIGLVVVCGLAVATVLTLVLLPTVYSLMDDMSLRVRRTVALAMVREEEAR